MSYEKFTLSEDKEKVYIRFYYHLAPDILFQHEINLLKKDIEQVLSLADPRLQHVAFQLGLMELLRYWKLTCSPKIILRAGALSSEQLAWWKKLFFYGLQEFFHVNSIRTDFVDFLHFEVESSQSFSKADFKTDFPLGEKRQLIPIGGGKDSIVTLELLAPFQPQNCCLIVNPQRARLESARIAGYASQDIIEVRRIHDEQLSRLSDQGYLNGHCPFSAFLAFLSLFVCALFGLKYIVVSHESSANEGNIAGSSINHQYSKSFSFEQDFTAYVRQHITETVQYFSILRPFNELQIAKYFSRLSPRYFLEFRSSNRLSGKNRWCGECAKCLFIQIILSPFLDASALRSIFPSSLFSQPQLLPIFLQLIGADPIKPFECVGTREEINTALSLALLRQKKEEGSESPLPFLLTTYREQYSHLMLEKSEIQILLRTYNKEHLVPEKFTDLLHSFMIIMSSLD